MRRFFILAFLSALALPAGITFTGCTSNPAGDYCNGTGQGLKVTDLASLTLGPATTGISLAYGQISQSQTPVAKTCTGDSAAVRSYTYAVTNYGLIDLSPSGGLCAGTWNRNSPGDIPDYTICTPTTQYGVTYLTASAQGITSNPVPIYVHPPITSVKLVAPTQCLSQYVPSTASNPNGCFGPTSSLDVIAYQGNSALCAPLTCSICNPGCTITPSSSGQDCSNVLGTVNYASSNTSVATIDQYGTITALQPGTTSITTTISQTSSVAGYFSTCPPASISVQTITGGTSGVVSKGTPLAITTTVTDTNTFPLTGLSLTYVTTNPEDFGVSASGISASFPGSASISALCLPPTCNPAPTNYIGQFGTGLPVVSNPVQVTSPGTSSTYLVMGSSKSQSIVPIDLTNGLVGSTAKLPYIPNSMLVDQTGSNIYFGSERELMIMSFATLTIGKEDISAPGKVLAVSPDNSKLVISNTNELINNQQVTENLLYIYNTSSGIVASYSGVGYRAAFTPDNTTVYIVGNDGTPAATPTLFVYNTFNGWSTYNLTAVGGGSDLALTVPSEGAYITGTDTSARGYCPSLAAGNPPTVLSYYPQADLKSYASDHIAATQDGKHILTVANSTNRLSDLSVTIPTGTCPQNANSSSSGLVFNSTLLGQLGIGVTPATANCSAAGCMNVIASPASNLAFITYSPSSSATAGALLPYYIPSSASATMGTMGSVTLSGGATAPISGVFSPDQTLFFTGTSGDNLVHFINVNTLTETQTINPKLVDNSGNSVPVEFLGVKPRVSNQ
jgi:hypothetical protein